MDKVLIAANPYGEIMTRNILDIEDESVLHCKFNKTAHSVMLNDDIDSDSDSDSSDREVDDDDEQKEDDISSLQLTRSDAIYEMVTEGSYVALRSMASSIELFFLAKVISKNVAYSNINDGNGHGILSGEKYLTVAYLEKDEARTKKTRIQYKMCKSNNSYVHLGEVCSPFVHISQELCMNVEEYHSLCAELF